MVSFVMATHSWVIVIFKKWDIERKMRVPNLGNDYFFLRDFKGATEHHQQSLSIAKDLGNKAAERDT